MPTRSVFRCQFCDAAPDHGTWRSLQGQVTERMFGEYLDAFPGRWLVWNGGGPLGPRRYACRKHRGDLVAYLRYHYATVAAQVWKMPPYEQRWPDEKRPRMGGSMGIIKFGLRGGLLQDAHPSDAKPPAPPPDPASPLEPVTPEDPFPLDELVVPEDPFPPAELLAPEDPSAPDELLGADDLFPPGELFVPEDLVPPPPADGPWPDDGSWPPGFPPDDPRPPGQDPPPAT
jgi:hypothetical protein